MEQVLINTPATLSESWYVDGVLVDPGVVTVTITRADGTVLAAAAATSGSGAVARTYNLAALSTGQMDRLTADWVSPTHGTLTSYVEIVGGFYFSVSEFKARYPNDSTVQDLTASQVAEARRTAEEIIEQACNVAFVPRALTLTVSGQRSTKLALPLYLLRTIESASIDGEVQDVSDYRVAGGAVYRWTSWPRNPSNVAIVVTHGYDFPPRRIKDAAMTLAYHRAVKGPIDDRATSIPAGEAGGVITLLTPGVQGAVTGIPEVDAAILAYRLPDPGSVSSVAAVDSADAYPDPLEDFATG